MKFIHVYQKILFDSFGNFAYITQKHSKKVSASDIPLSVTLQDDFKQSFEADLIAIIPFDTVIPEICAHHAMGCTPENALKILQNRLNITEPHELVYYLYKIKRL